VGSQSEFAEKLDVSVITISRIENGMTKIDAELLIKMSEVLQVPVNIILGIGQQEYFV
jgi:DNA-binding helix-turn-helix protein